MKKAVKIIMMVAGILLILFTLYYAFNVLFVVQVKNGVMYDGLGIELNKYGEHYLINDIINYIVATISFGCGAGLISESRKKENSNEKKQSSNIHKGID